jgi:hypothetical protein
MTTKPHRSGSHEPYSIRECGLPAAYSYCNSLSLEASSVLARERRATRAERWSDEGASMVGMYVDV